MPEKIVMGRKTIESRWYLHRRLPWDRIAAGDRVYFKNVGEKVTVMAEVERVEQRGGLNERKAAGILRRYGKQIGLEGTDAADFLRRVGGKQYCLLVFLKHAKAVEPFAISKEGFGSMASWITVENINSIRK